jgi:aminopeptidase N
MKRIAPLVLLLCSSLVALAQRLPETATPHHYILKFTPDLKNARFTGDETIHVTVNEPTSDIVVNSAEIVFQKVTIQALPNGPVQTAKVTVDPQKEFATFTVDEELPKGPAEIHIEYSGILNDQLRGFYLSKGRNRNYAVTQMEPTDARRAFPGWDEPAYKAPFDISVVVDDGDTAVSNGHIVKDVPGPGAGRHTITFSQTPKMSTYLVALAVGDWKCREGGVDGIPIRICSTPDKVAMTGEALTAAESIMHYYNQWYAIKYPYGKLDVLAAPDFSAGAMENTGDIIYREILLFYDPQHSSANLRKLVWDVLAHEMAHQWFGDLVTMQWWNDIWLNEGFATWMSPKPVRAAHPEWNNRMDEVDGDNGAMETDSLVSTRPIRQSAETPAEIGELFDSIAYSKTAAVLRMLEQYEGPQVFQKGTNDYLKAHAYANATAEDFWNAQTHASGKPIDKVMGSFVLQPGVPLVTADAKCTAGKTDVALTQQRFFVDRQAMQKGSNELWQIPVCLKYGAGASTNTQCDLVDKKQATVQLPVCADWVDANADARGYYRTAYAPASYNRIAAVAESKLSPEERLALLNSQWALVRNGSRDIGDYFNLVIDLKADRDRAIWEEIGGVMSYADHHLVSEQDAPRFRPFVASLYKPIVAELGYKSLPGDSADRRQLRREAIANLAIVAQDPEALAKCRELVQQEIKAPGSVDAEILPVAVIAAARFGGDAALYDQYLAAMKQEKQPERFYNFLYGLTFFRGPEFVKRSFELALGPEVRNQDATGFIEAEVGDPYNQKDAWNMLKADWPRLENKLSSYTRGEIVAVTSDFCDAAMRDDAKNFFSTKNLPAQRTFKQALEAADACIDVKQLQAPKLAQWLQQNVK